MERLIIKGGTVTTAEGQFVADIVCAEGRIVAIGSGFQAGDLDSVLDATGKLVLPGGIDVHTHFDEPFMGTTTADDFTAGGRAAVAGGITSHIDFAYQFKGESLRQGLQHWHEKARGKAIIDYGFHVLITDPTLRAKSEIPELIEDGYTSFKIYMTYPNLAVDDGKLLEILKIAGSHGGRVSVHAENFYISDVLVRSFHEQGRFDARWHPQARPWQSEWEATIRAIALAQVADAPLYVVHISAGPAVSAVAQAQASGQEVFGETCIHYLVLTEDVYDADGFEPAKYICSPPIRTSEHQDALWRALTAGTLEVVASDHDPFTLAERHRLGGDDFAKIPNGIAGIEQIRPLLWSEGVRRQRMTPELFVAVTSTNPARLFGLFPKKGAIGIGSDADLVIWDPDLKVTLTSATTHSTCDYCVYEGREVIGYAATTISRGEIVWRDGTVCAEPGRGRFISRGRLS